ncbi:MAG TPA: phosphatase PAP2 family protein [Frankiaceae bacterium]|nr:phosphatase PAP2 family protein [Frankiaceae bacterium]
MTRWVAGLLGLIGFAVLAVLVLVHPGSFPLDRWLHRLAVEHRQPVLGLASFVTNFGTGPVLVPLLLLAGIVAARRTGVRWVVLAGVAGLLLGQGVRLLAMVLVDRPRPPMSDWARFASGTSFPSGHSTSAALGYGLMLLLLAPSVHGRARRVLLSIGLVTVAGLVGVSRVVLGVHWPTDVLGGWSLALLLLAVAALLFEKLGLCPDPMPAAPTSSVP